MLSLYLSMIPDEAAKTAFEELYLQHRQIMLYAANQILRDWALSEDAVHDAFLRILNNFENISRESCNKTRAFVVIIVRNIALDYCKKRRRHPEDMLTDFGEEMLDEQTNPEAIYLADEGSRKILRALEKLQPSAVDILALRAQYHCTDAEIGQLLNISEANVRVRLHRARKELAQILEEEDRHG
jgi:RNA polymerase sigma-70 factor (ECF subfamily)